MYRFGGMLETVGEIIKKNDELGYGFISVKGSEDVFFSPDTEYSGTTFSNLKIGEKVKIAVSETARGLFAIQLAAISEKRKSPEPEASL